MINNKPYNEKFMIVHIQPPDIYSEMIGVYKAPQFDFGDLVLYRSTRSFRSADKKTTNVLLLRQLLTLMNHETRILDIRDLEVDQAQAGINNAITKLGGGDTLVEIYHSSQKTLAVVRRAAVGSNGSLGIETYEATNPFLGTRSTLSLYDDTCPVLLRKGDQFIGYNLGGTLVLTSQDVYTMPVVLGKKHHPMDILVAKMIQKFSQVVVNQSSVHVNDLLSADGVMIYSPSEGIHTIDRKFAQLTVAKDIITKYNHFIRNPNEEQYSGFRKYMSTVV